MHIPEPHAPGVFAARRHALAARLHAPAVLAAGLPSPRNFAANTWAFRAHSHFLYLVGAHIPGGLLLLEPGRSTPATLFAPVPPPDDALWHGPTPDHDALSARLGLAVEPLTVAASRIAGAASVPAPDRAGHDALVADLGRAPDPGRGADLDLARALVAVRSVHDAAAIDELRAAARLTAIAHAAGMAATRAGATAHTVRGAMEGALLAEGAGVAYHPIVTPHGEVLHNHEHHPVLAPGDLLLADVGAETPLGWAGDVTRTWPVSGRYDAAQRDLYDVVLASQIAAIEAVQPGAEYRDVHLTAARVLADGLVSLGILRGEPDALVEDDVHALFFPHGVGHLLGLDVHDMEDLGDLAGYAAGRSRSTRFGLNALRLDRPLEVGMVVTVEPGFYQVPAILEDPARRARVGDRVDWDRLAVFASVRGIRIEDDVLVTEDGCEVLTSDIPKDASAVEACVGA